MPNSMSASQWNDLFPTWPARTGGSSADAILAAATKAVKVATMIYLPIAWDGQASTEELEDRPVLARAGRWCVTEHEIVCLGAAYGIPTNRLEETDWLAHCLTKHWLYDPTDMLDAIELAQEYMLPGSTLEQRQSFFERQMHVCLERQIQPFFPSRLVSQHAYLVSRMPEQVRLAFAEFWPSGMRFHSHTNRCREMMAVTTAACSSEPYGLWRWLYKKAWKQWRPMINNPRRRTWRPYSS